MAKKRVRGEYAPGPVLISPFLSENPCLNDYKARQWCVTVSDLTIDYGASAGVLRTGAHVTLARIPLDLAA